VKLFDRKSEGITFKGFVRTLEFLQENLISGCTDASCGNELSKLFDAQDVLIVSRIHSDEESRFIRVCFEVFGFRRLTITGA
jgi:hypothetical protein